MTAEKTFYFIPHTHWEGAVFKTREEYLDIGLPHILEALRLLKRYPDYRFVLDQVCYVKPFLERYPEEESAFRQFVKEGRLAIVGGTLVMLDVNMPGGESFIRQVLYSKGFFRKALGVDVTVSWQLDTFGHHAQIPQLLKLAGYRSFWFFRGVSDWSVPSEFFWQGLDGSQIPAYWLPEGYAVTYGSPQNLPEFTEFFIKQYETLAPFSRLNSRVGLAGADVCEPEEHVPALVEQFNLQPDMPFQIKMAVPGEYEAAIDSETGGKENTNARLVVKGELNPIFQGIYSSRIELKQRTRELERMLTAAEKLGVLLRWLGNTISDDIIWRAWEPMLFNQAHDLMSGVMTDHVYEDTIRGYDFSGRIANQELQTRLREFVANIDTCGEGIALVVFNPLSWARSDIVVANVGFSEDTVFDIKVLGNDGQPYSVQLIEAERFTNGALLRTRIAFIARNVPALGYIVYRLVAQKTVENPSNFPVEIHETSLENNLYRLEFDAASGVITRLVVKDQDWSVLRRPGNVVAMQEDRGDLWEPYNSLDGGSRIAMKDRHAAPDADQAVFSTAQASSPGSIIQGPVFSEYSAVHPFSSQGQFKTTVRLYHGLRRIDISTKILNNDQFVRYRVLFPTSIEAGQITQEIPFGAILRPDGIEFPAQNWMDYGSEKHGLALLNRGLPGNNTAEGVMMLSLMRSTCIVAYGFSGGYEPGMSSDSGLELGKELTFDYALLPHAGDWQKAGVYREGLEFNQPLLAFPAADHPGRLPGNWGFLEISHANIIMSAFKGSQDGSPVLRLYEAAGLPTNGVSVKINAQVISAEGTNLMEDPGAKLSVNRNTIQLDFRPFEIKTIKLSLI